MQTSEQVIFQISKFAETAHRAQVRKFSGDPYVVHPKRVMEICRQYTEDVATLCGALLHDVLEDTAVTHDELQSFLNTVMDTSTATATIRIVDELTDRFIKANFPKLNRRLRREKEAHRLALVSTEAQTVKYADIIDNTDVTENDRDFEKVYLREAYNMLQLMDKGNPQLRGRAIEQVQNCLKQVASYPQIR